MEIPESVNARQCLWHLVVSGRGECAFLTSFMSALRRSLGLPGTDGCSMKNWVKTFCTKASPSVVRFAHGVATVTLTIVLLGSRALPQSDSATLGISAHDLARKVITNELKSQDKDHGHWMYRLEKEEFGKKQIEEIVETNDGSLSRLLSVDGRSLDATQQREEDQRLERLVSHPDEQRKIHQASNRKTEQGVRLFNTLPDVFVFSYAGRQGDLVALTFRPNPDFEPPSMESRVLHSMQGEMTVDIKQERLVAISGHLTEDVKFGGGLLGHLDKGGNFEVTQAEVAPGHWEVTFLNVEMKGKALVFKTIGVQETETHCDYRRVSDDQTLAEAAVLLNRQTVVADNR
jgi:hypothetical protein